MNHVVEKCNHILENLYGDRLQGLILYGSVARGDADKTSDIDLLVLLEKPLDYFKELRTITDALYQVQLESEHLISAKPVDITEYENGEIQLYRNARSEGVAV